MSEKKKVVANDVEDVLALSPMQEGILYHSLKNPHTHQYIEQLHIELAGQLQMTVFRRAWEWVIAQNEMLRVVFRWKESERPLQIILKALSLEIPLIDLSTYSADEQKKQVLAYRDTVKNMGFDLEEGPLMQIALLRLSSESWELSLTYHHILIDGWSTGIILKEFFQSYLALTRGCQPLKPQKQKFKEYLKSFLNRDVKSSQEFWESYLRGFISPTRLPFAQNHFGKPLRVENYQTKLSPIWSKDLENFAQQLAVTISAVLSTVWGILLQKYNTSHDVIFGVTVSGRSAQISGIEEMVGLFINTLPQRFCATADQSLRELIQQVYQDSITKKEFADTPLIEIQSVSSIGKIFDSLLVVENYPLDELAAESGLLVKNYSTFEMTNFSLTIVCEPRENLQLNFIYYPDIFCLEDMQQVSTYFWRILKTMITDPERKLAELDFVSPEEKTLLLRFANSFVEDDNSETILDIWRQQVRKTPDQIAVTHNQQSWTYRQIDFLSDHIAFHLRAVGLDSEQIAALLVVPSLEMIIGVLGIFKAGGAYLPLDPTYPDQRMVYMIEDSGAKLLILGSGVKNPALQITVFSLEKHLKNLAEISAADLARQKLSFAPKKDSLAYVIYTSGSTGWPKGVLVEHHSLLSALKSVQLKCPTNLGDTWLLKTTYTFDVSLTELCAWFFGGGSVAILSVAESKDPRQILWAINSYEVTHLNFVPAMFNAFLDYLEVVGDQAWEIVNKLRYLMLAGEEVQREQVKRFYQITTAVELINLYGPTEGTIYATSFELSQVQDYLSVPIGKALDHVELYILNEDFQLQPKGFIGELCIGGVALARGYLNRPELTREKFVTHPFKTGQKIYRTGDLGRWLKDGNIEFLGRRDQQIKVRGYRIEVGEIVNQLLSHPDIREAVVIANSDTQTKDYLSAYLVTKEELSKEELRQYLRKTLPEYMIPTNYFYLQHLPITNVGKLDYQALQKITSQISSKEFLAPRSPVEKKLADIWSQVLAKPEISIDDNFFVIGGHSLKAVQIITKVMREFKMEITLDQFYEKPTISGLADLIFQESLHESWDHELSIPIQPKLPYYPVSAAQKRIYLLQQLDLESIAYNLPIILEVDGNLDRKKCADIFMKLVQRHTVLRTGFRFQNGQIYQEVCEGVSFRINYIEITEANQINAQIDSFISPFDLTSPPLFRVGLIKVDKERYLLMIDLHHIISDGVSLAILMREFTLLYAEKELVELCLSYHDYAVWQNQQKLLLAADYWLEEFSGEISAVDLPLDYARPVTQSFRGQNYQLVLEKDLLTTIDAFIRREGVTLFTLLITSYQLLLMKYTGQEELVVGTPVSVRSLPDLENLIGIFTNTLAIRSQPSREKTFMQYLHEVKVKIQKALTHQEYPFEMLIEKLEISRDGYNPLFKTMFSFLDYQGLGIEFELPGLVFREKEYFSPIAKFDLLLTVIKSDELICNFEYATDLFKTESVIQFARHFKELLQQVISNPTKRLKELQILSAKEKDRLLFTLNDTRREYPEKTVNQLFEQQAKRTPTKVAVSFAEKSLSYQELNLYASHLADKLQKTGVHKNMIVGLLLERSLEMIVGILGILKAGGAYLTIDPDYPENRLEYIVADGGIRLLLTTKRSERAIFKDIEQIIFQIDEFTDFANNLCRKRVAPINDLETQVTPDSLAYVMYTSGSTGEPKGVMINHRGIVRLLFNNGYLTFDQEERILQLAPASFDASTFEIWASLLFGGQLILLPKEEVMSIKELSLAIKRYRVTTCWLTSSLFNKVIDEAPDGLINLQKLLIGGEALSMTHVKTALSLFPGIQLINGYGPTENTTFTCCYQIEELAENLKSIPIGRPISNTRVYILDKDLQLVPPGVVGEIYIAGDGLARGYLNKADLTKTAFLPNPLIPGEIIYKSGDLGRYLLDGNLEFLGRRDQQVKVRGFRIELAEIETHLLRHPLILHGVVILKLNEKDEKNLVAYYVLKEEGSIFLSASELRTFLSKNLPEYMLPNFLIPLLELPMMSNGKIDRQALAHLPIGRVSEEYRQPENEIEEKLQQIFCQVLGCEQVGIDQSFFVFGGHSLNAAAVTEKIFLEWQVAVSLRVFFQYPTIKDLSRIISRAIEDSSGQKLDYPSIRVQPESEYYPASSAQKRLYILHNLAPESANYNIPAILEISGQLDLCQFESALRELINRHQILRTVFTSIAGEIRQQILPKIDLKLAYKSLPTVLTENMANDMLQAFVKPFELNIAPLFRLELLRVTAEKHYLLFDIHHIIADGFSLEIIFSELSLLYQGKGLKKLGIQYRDYASWQIDFLQSEQISRQESFWLEEFSEEIPLLELPIDYQRPQEQSFAGESITIPLEKRLDQDLLQLAALRKVTLFTLLFSSYSLLLRKYTGQENLIIGLPLAGRTHTQLRELIGMFVNTLAVRVCPEGELTFSQYLALVQEKLLKVMENQDYQLELLVNQLDLPVDLGRNPLFDTVFALQKDLDTTWLVKGSEISFRRLPLKNLFTKFDLTVTAINDSNGLSLTFEYSSALFTEDTIRQMARHFSNLLQDIVVNPQQKIKEIEIIIGEEKERLLYEFNQTETDYPAQKTVHQIFQEQVVSTPENIAVRFATQNIAYSYQQLNLRANQLAKKLRELGVKPNMIIGLLVEHSPQMIVGLLAILKAGGAYLPIDPLYPQKRQEFMLKDASVTILITQSQYNISNSSLMVIDLDEFFDEPSRLTSRRDDNLENKNTSSDLAYLMYTSGSTGKPKGVMVPHQGLVRLVCETNYLQFTPDERILQIATFAFDAFTFELVASLFFGGQLIMVKREQVLAVEKLAEIISSEQITTCLLTTSLFHKMIDEVPEGLTGLHNLVVGGEVMSLAHGRRAVKLLPNTVLINAYGPTENTTITSTYQITKIPAQISSIPIGKPISNTRIYILDRDLQLVPLGVIGEIHIAGDGLALGYLNRPQLTAGRFIENPFIPGEIIYRSGDLGRYLPDGNLEFCGRSDQQVKVRGYRIELTEIERLLSEYPLVNNALVLVREDNDGNRYLVAYLVLKAENIKLDLLRNYLEKNLPQYMIPHVFFQLEELPLLANGKVDKKALPYSSELVINSEHILPKNQWEKKLVEIFHQVLGVKQIGITDNFFHLGGHSLKASQVVTKINEEFAVSLHLGEFFRHPVVKELAELIAQKEQINYQQIIAQPPARYFPVSSAQKRLFLLHQLEKESISYNVPLVIEITGKLDLERFRQAFLDLIARQESFRTGFRLVDGEIRQEIHPTIDFEYEYSSISAEEIAVYIKDFLKPFTLSDVPLWRCQLLKLTGERHILLFDLHHCIFDGFSQHILMKEFADLYSGQKLPSLRIQYRDFAVWQNQLAVSDQFTLQRAYWLKEFSLESSSEPSVGLPRLNLALDYARPPLQSYTGSFVECSIDSDLLAKLRQLSQKTTIFITLLTTYYILLARYTGQEDIIIGTPIANRNHSDLEKIIGMFVNTLALRNYPQMEKHFLQFLEEVNEKVILAFANQDYQFEMLITDLNLYRDLSRHPLFDLVFVYETKEEAIDHWSVQDLSLRNYPYEYPIAKFDLTLYAQEVESGLKFTFNYSNRLFKRETIQQMAKHYLHLLQAICHNPQKKLWEFSMLDSAEKKNILERFNQSQAEYSLERVVHQIFADQASQRPDQIALVCQKRELTYGELNQMANRLAALLRAKGVQRETLVGVMTGRTIELIVAILGILKAGGGYVPLGSNSPIERIRFLLSDSEIQLLVIEEEFLRLVPADFTGEVINLDQVDLEAYSPDNLQNWTKIDDLAYIIYTSGSTGRPKGVMISQHNLIRLFFTKPRNYDFSSEDVWTLFHSYCFDFSVWEIFGALLFGGKLIIIDQEGRLNPQHFLQMIKEQRVTVLNQTPAAFYNLLQAELKASKHQLDEHLRYVIFGGEALNFSRLRPWVDLYSLEKVRLINMYGITETTVHVTFEEIKQVDLASGRSLIGRPIYTTTVYLLDRYLQPVPLGVPGEICVGGPGVARGYLNRPELTKEKFIPHPFLEQQRLYRSGDLGRYLLDGTIEYLGRIDRQLKIRGFRIEVGEIEYALLKHSLISEVIIVDREDSLGTKYLVCYFVAKADLDLPDLRQYLLTKLPDYMVPQYFCQIPELPLTANGKVNLQALPEVLMQIETGIDYVAPRNEVEIKIGEIWKKVFCQEKIGVLDNFFDLGGNSLLLVKIFEELRAQFPEMPLQITDLFKYNSIAKLAEFISNQGVPEVAAFGEDPEIEEFII